MTKVTSTDRKLQELNIFHDVAKALTSSLDLDSILQTIMEKMAEYFRPDTWSLLMVDEAPNELYFAIAVGAASEALKDVRLKVGEGIAGWVAKHGERLIVPDVMADPEAAAEVETDPETLTALISALARGACSPCWDVFFATQPQEMATFTGPSWKASATSPASEAPRPIGSLSAATAPPPAAPPGTSARGGGSPPRPISRPRRRGAARPAPGRAASSPAEAARGQRSSAWYCSGLRASPCWPEREKQEVRSKN